MDWIDYWSTGTFWRPLAKPNSALTLVSNSLNDRTGMLSKARNAFNSPSAGFGSIDSAIDEMDLWHRNGDASITLVEHGMPGQIRLGCGDGSETIAVDCLASNTSGSIQKLTDFLHSLHANEGLSELRLFECRILYDDGTSQGHTKSLDTYAMLRQMAIDSGVEIVAYDADVAISGGHIFSPTYHFWIQESGRTVRFKPSGTIVSTY